MFSPACPATARPRPLSPAARPRPAPADTDRGITTTEYALCILTAAAFAGIMYAIAKSQAVNDAFTGIVINALGNGL
ncbi:hypothetical protein SUDANB121_03335 [Nocardiopsis dassonvillei]|uniref:DUF4244 domain-containing protein n=1 Tax=Nocardiopsis dassonvillei TaxID=2014 RepID=UPI003F56DF01